jgi:molybdenum cofactor guanylyltransferase
MAADPMHLALLAGGRSTRMGRDKATMRVAGEPLLERLARLGSEAGLAILICGRGQPAAWHGPPATFLRDAQPDDGPLRGLEAALAVADEVVLLACDLPCFSAAACAWLIAQPRGRLGTAVSCAGALQPLASIYTIACQPHLAEAFASGRRSLRNLLRHQDFHQVTVPSELVGHFIDADDPHTWIQLGLTLAD